MVEKERVQTLPSVQAIVNIFPLLVSDRNDVENADSQCADTLKALGAFFVIPRRTEVHGVVTYPESGFDDAIYYLLLGLATPHNSSYVVNDQHYLQYFRNTSSMLSSYTDLCYPPIILEYIKDISSHIRSNNLTLPLFELANYTDEVAQSLAFFVLMVIIRASQTTRRLSDLDRVRRTNRLTNTYKSFRTRLFEDYAELKDTLRLPEDPTYEELEVFNALFTLPGRLYPDLDAVDNIRPNMKKYFMIQGLWRRALVQHEIVDYGLQSQSIFLKPVTEGDINVITSSVIQLRQLIDQLFKEDRSISCAFYNFRTHSQRDFMTTMDSSRLLNFLTTYLRDRCLDYDAIKVDGKTPFDFIAGFRRLLLSFGIEYETMLRLVPNIDRGPSEVVGIIERIFERLNNQIHLDENDEETIKAFNRAKSIAEAELGGMIFVFVYYVKRIFELYGISRYTPLEILDRIDFPQDIWK